MKLSTPRFAFTGIFVACLVLIAYALFLQHAQALEPCPMCILQRYVFILIGMVALVAAAVNARRLVLTILSGAIVVLSLAGAGVAIRHSWLQHFPNPSQNCGAELSYLLELPLSSGLPAIFRGTGDCSAVQWTMLGLSIPEWALVWFVMFAVVGVMLIGRSRQK